MFLLHYLMSPDTEIQRQSRSVLHMLSFIECITGMMRACSKIMTKETSRGVGHVGLFDLWST